MPARPQTPPSKPRTTRLLLPMMTSLALMVTAPATAQTPTPSASASARPGQDLRFVVFHTPGPAWQTGRSVFEQPGIRAHIAHYRQWLDNGQLQLGGPHLDAQGGGMMIPKPGLSEEEVRRFAEADPAVQSGLLRVTVRPWLIGMGG